MSFIRSPSLVYKLRKSSHKQPAFTIIELLIVIVVIAILAAVTLVSYDGIANRTRQSAMQSTLSQVASKLAVYAAQNNDTYPPDSTSMRSVVGLLSSGYDIRYLVDSGTTAYCMQVSGKEDAYYLTNVKAFPRSGRCDTYQGMSSDATYTIWSGGDNQSTSQYWSNGTLIATNLVKSPKFSNITFGLDHDNGGSAQILNGNTLRISGQACYLINMAGFAEMRGLVNSTNSEGLVLVLRATAQPGFSSSTYGWGVKGQQAATLSGSSSGWQNSTTKLFGGTMDYIINIEPGARATGSLIVSGGGSSSDVVDWTNYALYTRADWTALQSLGIGYFDGGTAPSLSYK